MWHQRPYRGARPLADQREHVDLLAATLLHHQRAGSTGPARQERAYRLHRAVLDDRVACSGRPHPSVNSPPSLTNPPGAC
ncbi:hypothetical protein [Streptomyces murinus]|uniref:hypothetical protein n=1 Tax=Streptomyces murinus TaxID=33900 RepID=UPI0038306380